jgi:Arc/MetJ-type ribon-helix-helix transcriptional regulator
LWPGSSFDAIGQTSSTVCKIDGESVLGVVHVRRFVSRMHGRYDTGMTKAKIAISLPKEQLARVHREIRAGRAESVSGYIAHVLAEHEKRESLRALLRDLTAQYGEPGTKDIRWAERALAPRRG